MGEAKNMNTNKSDYNHQPLESCPKSYRPWIWTLLLMAIVTIIWTVVENYREGGVMKSLIEADDLKGVSKNKMQNLYSTGGIQPVKTQPGIVQNSFHEIIDLVRPALISIDASVQGGGMRNPGQGFPGMNYSGVGSGIIIDPKGYVLSSLHVIAGSTTLKAWVYNQQGAKEYPLKVVNVNKKNDLVLLRIMGVGPFPYAFLGDSDKTRTGDMVLALGSPYGFDHTVTTGIISSRNRSINIGGKIYEGIIQTDTPINRGNSGGPLVNVRGEVIGINTAIYSPTGNFSGIGFAVPVNQASTLVAGVVDFRNSPIQVAGGMIAAWGSMGRQMGNAFKQPGGQVVPAPHVYRGRCVDCHPQLLDPNNVNPNQIQPGVAQPVAGLNVPQSASIGATFLDVDSVVANHFNLLHSGGALVDRVYGGTPADSAGLQRGDIVMRVDGRRVINVVDMRRYLGSKKIGTKFDLVVLSNGSRKSLKVKTIVRPAFIMGPTAAALPREITWFGSEIAALPKSITPFVKMGVYVTDADGVLRAAGVMKGDVIQRIDRTVISDLSVFQQVKDQVNIRSGFLMEILRNGKMMYIKVKA